MTCDRETLLWYILSKKEDVGYKERKELITYCKTIEDAFQLSKEKYMILDFLSDKAKVALMKEVDLDKELYLYDKMTERGVKFTCPFHDDYPQRLLKMYDPPHFLYYLGALPDDTKPSVAVIGARNCTNYGMGLATELSKELANYGIQIISGLARGIDGCAHKGALAAQGKTYGVIGHGVDSCYPSENTLLYHDVEVAGGIISEYPIGSKALAFHFPIRNRIIAGLSDGIVVVEAKEKSGTLITVDCGLEQGKDIFAIPGRVTEPLSIGCNRLIQNGAKLVLSVNDIIEELSIRYPQLLEIEEKSGQLTMKNKSSLSSDEKQVINYMKKEIIFFEQMLQLTGFTTAKLVEVINSLKIKGVIKEVTPQHYMVIYGAQ